MIFALLILGFTTHTSAFQCDQIFSHRACGEYKAATENLKSVLHTLEGSLAQGMSEIAQHSAYYYSTALPVFLEQDFNGKIIKLNNQKTVKIGKNTTVADLKKILKAMQRQLDFLKRFGIENMFGLEEAMKHIHKLITDSLVPSDDQSIGYSTPDEVKEHFEKAKQSIRNALKDVNVFTRNAIMLVVNRFHGHINTFTKLVDDTLAKFGITSTHWSAVKEVIDKALKNLKEKIGGEAASKTADALNKAEASLFSMIDAISQEQDDDVAYGISSLWEKFKTAVKDLGKKIKTETKKIIEEQKPKIMEALKKQKNIVIKGLQELLVKFNGKLINIIVDKSD